jgi:hypothetical protein
MVNDGEWSKPDYSTYVKNRLTGLNQLQRSKCNGLIAWKDFDAVQHDVDNLRAAVGATEGAWPPTSGVTP